MRLLALENMPNYVAFLLFLVQSKFWSDEGDYDDDWNDGNGENGDDDGNDDNDDDDNDDDDDGDDGGPNNWSAKWQQRIFLAATLSEHFHSKLASAAGRCYIITERFPIIFEL